MQGPLWLMLGEGVGSVSPRAAILHATQQSAMMASQAMGMRTKSIDTLFDTAHVHSFPWASLAKS